GILAQPAQALELLCQHQDDDWDGPAEPTDPDQQPREPEVELDGIAEPDDADPGSDFQETATVPIGKQPSMSDPAANPVVTPRSLQVAPPPFDPEKARPRAVVYVHVSAEAVTAGTGITRVEDIGPVLL